MYKAAFKKKKALSTSKLDLHFKVIKQEISTFGALLFIMLKIGHLGKIDQKYLKICEVFWWRGLERSSEK
jgi:hypothetical protein